MKGLSKWLPKGKGVAYVFDFTYPGQVHRLGSWNLKIRKRGKITTVIAAKRRTRTV